MPPLRWLAGCCLAVELCAQVSFFPLKEIRPGLQGIGKTVFYGERIDEFKVQILGVLENAGPKQSIILARLSGGPLETAGVLQGMSGSPVYIGGRLVGAVALAFPFSKEPIAGIRPIEEMLRAAGPAVRGPISQRVSLLDQKLPAPWRAASAEGKLVDIATPVSFSGFTEGALQQFGGELRAFGLEPRQGMGGSGGARRGPAAAALQPGSMISVQLVSGDMNVGADGTVTHVDGNRILAFGHRFLSIGPAELPFARAEVLALLPTLSSSFKISTAREWLGTITEDGSTAVAGVLGRRTSLTPVSIEVNRRAPSGALANRTAYRFNVVNDPYLTPLLLQIALFSAIDATERSVGPGSLAIHGELRFQNGVAPIQVRNMFSGDAMLPAMTSLAAVMPLAYAMQSGFQDLRLESISLVVDSYVQRKQWQIDQVWASRSSVRPGETLDLTILLAGENGAELTRRVSYRLPVGADLGPLYFTVADGTTSNMTDYWLFAGQAPKSIGQLISTANALRGNTKIYVRVWRAEPDFLVQGEDLPGPPPSVAMILMRTPSVLIGAPPGRGSKMAEMEIPVERSAVSGSKTLQVEVKE